MNFKKRSNYSLFIINYSFLLTFFFAACSQSPEKEKTTNPKKEIKSNKYAQGFSIEKKKNYKLVTVKNPWQGAKNIEYKYALVHKLSKLFPEITEKDAITIPVPVNKIVCMSTTHIAMLDLLDETKSIAGISGCQNVYNKKVRKLIEDKKIIEVGFNQSLNYEKLVELKPDFIMVFGVGSGISNQIEKLKSLGIKVVINAEYLESSPLGKAEWCKFVSSFFNKEKMAEQKFSQIEKEYNNCKNKVQNINKKPSILCNIPWKGTWYVPGGNSYFAQLIKDAGGNYLWKNDNSRKSLSLNIESILLKAGDADIWLNTGQAKVKEDILKVDERLKNFTAYNKNSLFNNNARQNKIGMNDFWESSVINPHLILKDLIKIMHPNILPEHNFVYYRKL